MHKYLLITGFAKYHTKMYKYILLSLYIYQYIQSYIIKLKLCKLCIYYIDIMTNILCI